MMKIMKLTKISLGNDVKVIFKMCNNILPVIYVLCRGFIFTLKFSGK